MRIVKLDELQFLFCVKNQVWGSNRSNLKNWENRSLLLFKVDNEAAGLAEITGDYYISDDIVWDNGLFEHRRPLKFIKLFQKKDRLAFDLGIKKLLIDEWGRFYGNGILNGIRLSTARKDAIISLLNKCSSANHLFYEQIDSMIANEKAARKKEIELYSNGALKATEKKYKTNILDL